jgi:hypothetical protein
MVVGMAMAMRVDADRTRGDSRVRPIEHRLQDGILAPQELEAC